MQKTPTVSGLPPDVVDRFLSSVGKKKPKRLADSGLPMDVEGSPFETDELVVTTTYVAFDDVLCRMPGRNYARLERYSPLDGGWVWYGPHATEVGIKGKRISEDDAAKMAQRLYEKRDECTFSEENMPKPLIDLTPESTFAPATSGPPVGVDPEDWATFMAQQAEKRKAKLGKGPGHVCVLPGFDAAAGMACQACLDGKP